MLILCAMNPNVQVTREAEDIVMDRLLPKRRGWTWVPSFELVDEDKVEAKFTLKQTRKSVHAPECARHDHAKFPVSARLGVTVKTVLQALRNQDGQLIRLLCDGVFCNMTGTFLSAVWLQAQRVCWRSFDSLHLPILLCEKLLFILSDEIIVPTVRLC